MALHIVHKFSFSRNDIKKTDFSNSQFMMITPLSTQTTSMGILIVDYSVSRDTIEKNTDLQHYMWLHLRPVRWIMLTEVSSYDGSIVHPTHQPTSSQTLTPECEILVSELLPIF